MQVLLQKFQNSMTEAEELVDAIVTVDDGLKLISSLEKKQAANQFGKRDANSKNIPAILDEFKAQFYKIQVVSLTVAIEPTQDLLVKLQSWFSENLGQRVIFDLKVDPQIIGGIKLICRNHFRDFSLSSTIEDITKSEFMRDEVKAKEPGVMPAALI